MPLHFTYSEVGDEPDLRQGDILSRSDYIERLLVDHYPTYAANFQNRYFIVLTQCCDLARRDGKPCSARYIAIAPIRPLAVLLERKLKDLCESDIGSEIPVSAARSRQRLQDWLAKLMNNNEPDYFYLQNQQEKGIGDNACAFLALSIAIKSDVHYQECVEARVLALADSFRAKLGWLVGQMYSRIGTEDWLLTDISREISSTVEDLSIWLEPRKLKALRGAIAKWRSDNPPTAQIAKEELLKLVKAIPSRKAEVLEQVLNVLESKGVVTKAQKPKIQNYMSSDPKLADLLKD